MDRNAHHFQLYIGPMFSGKTTGLLQALSTLKYAVAHQKIKKRVVLIKHSKDFNPETGELRGLHCSDGSDPYGWTGAELQIRSDLITDNEDLSDVYAIGVDEGQFFSDLREACETWLTAGVRVYVAGLSCDSEGNTWKAITDVLPMATEIVYKTAFCVDCGGVATFNDCLVPKNALVMIGGKGTYASRCYFCHVSAKRGEKELQ